MDQSPLNPVLLPFGLFIGSTHVGKGLFVKKYIQQGEYVLQNETPLVSWPVNHNEDIKFCEICMKPGDFEEVKRANLCSEACKAIASNECLGTFSLFGEFILKARAMDARASDQSGTVGGNPVTTEALIRSYAKVLSSTLVTLVSLPPETDPRTKLQIALSRSVTTFDQFCRPYGPDMALYNQDLDIFALQGLVRGMCNVVHGRLAAEGVPTDMFTTWSENILLEDNILTLVGQICLNFKKFALKDGVFLGSGIYQVSSSINHSCVPNAELVFEDDNSNVYIRALGDIRPYSEVTISYVETNESVMDRNMLLLGFYKFTCTCPKCLDEGVGQVFTDDMYVNMRQKRFLECLENENERKRAK